MVKDIYAGSSGSSSTYLTAVGDTLYFSANDGVNGAELWKLEVDILPPTGTVSINADALNTSSTLVTLTLSASDALSTVTEMIVCDSESFTACDWEAYQTSKSYTFSDDSLGTKTIYVKFKDSEANESDIYTDTIELVSAITPTPEPTTTPEPTPTPTPDSADDSDSSSSKKEYIQIPGAIKELFTTALVNKPIKDSNTNGQSVLAIIFPETFDFNAYLSSHFTSANHIANLREVVKQTDNKVNSNMFLAGWSGKELMGFKDKGTIYWQVASIQQINYKAYPALGKTAPVIIPELQAKDSIIALKYIDTDLIPPGEPDTKFNENILRLAHSLDGINWQVIPSSVVDTVNNTVAALAKVAGYYTIVGRY
jgi:hypothetical protein